MEQRIGRWWERVVEMKAEIDEIIWLMMEKRGDNLSILNYRVSLGINIIGFARQWKRGKTGKPKTPSSNAFSKSFRPTFNSQLIELVLSLDIFFRLSHCMEKFSVRALVYWLQFLSIRRLRFKSWRVMLLRIIKKGESIQIHLC